jgi:hypothetical protein
MRIAPATAQLVRDAWRGDDPQAAAFSPGSSIRLTLIRQAKPMELSVKPIECDLPVLSEGESSSSSA